MTALNSKLIEMAAQRVYDDCRTFPMHLAVKAAQAALEACHAEELAGALRNLLEDTQHHNHACGDTPENCPVLRAREILAKLDDKP
jgi:hypothetical protein